MEFPVLTINSGYVSVPPSRVAAGKKEAIQTAKVPDRATGTSGTVYWDLQVPGRFIRGGGMYSAPYSFDFHSNQFAVGISPEIGNFNYSPERSSFNFVDMYYGGQGGWFRRRAYYNNIGTIEVC